MCDHHPHFHHHYHDHESAEGSDAWVSRKSVVAGREEVVHGAIALQPLRLSSTSFFIMIAAKTINIDHFQTAAAWFL